MSVIIPDYTLIRSQMEDAETLDIILQDYILD